MTICLTANFNFFRNFLLSISDAGTAQAYNIQLYLTARVFDEAWLFKSRC
jgi:hypothetical protein